MTSFLFEETYFGADSWMFNVVAFTAAILIGLELLTLVVTLAFSSAPSIPIRGKNQHLDTLSSTDNAYIITNKFVTVAFVYHLVSVSQILSGNYS